MAEFYFVLKAGEQTVPDIEVQEFSDEMDARRHAVVVVKELMRNREAKTRLWKLQVCDGYLEPLFEVPFADVDDMIGQLTSDLRGSIQQARTADAWSDACARLRTTLGEIQTTLVRAQKILGSNRPGSRV
jgi:hypothetical protein